MACVCVECCNNFKFLRRNTLPFNVSVALTSFVSSQQHRGKTQTYDLTYTSEICKTEYNWKINEHSYVFLSLHMVLKKMSSG